MLKLEEEEDDSTRRHFCINLGDRTQICLIKKLQRFPFNQNLRDWLSQSQGDRTQICLINKLQRFPFNQNLGDWLSQSQGDRTQICLINKLQLSPRIPLFSLERVNRKKMILPVAIFDINLGDWLSQSQGDRTQSRFFEKTITVSFQSKLGRLTKSISWGQKT